MSLTPMASRLLADMEASHKALLGESNADLPVRHGFRAVYEAVSAALSGIDDDDLVAAPSVDEWSMAEVVEHLAEHDRKYMELAQLGIEHYVEHGLEHASQLWKLRTGRLTPEKRTSATMD
jgi:hypothetical protein